MQPVRKIYDFSTWKKYVYTGTTSITRVVFDNGDIKALSLMHLPAVIGINRKNFRITEFVLRIKHKILITYNVMKC